jgi:hypothetical protein
MKICLFTEAYELLRKHVPVQTPAHAALIAAKKASGHSSSVFDLFYVQCSDVDADMYLAAAEEFFRERLREIESAVTARRR